MALLRKKASIDDPTKLSGVEKAAVVLLGLRVLLAVVHPLVMLLVEAVAVADEQV